MPPNAETRPVRLPARSPTKRIQGAGDEETEVQERNNHLQARRRRQTPNGTTNAVGTGLVVAGAAYCTIRGAVQLFHVARRRALRGMLLDLVPVLEEAGCVYWLDFGTLLGVYRDDDIILHDNDCDVGILDPDWAHLEALLNKRLRGKGYWTKVGVVGREARKSTCFTSSGCAIIIHTAGVCVGRPECHVVAAAQQPRHGRPVWGNIGRLQ